MNNYLLKEISDEALDLKKLIQKHKIDIKENNLSDDQSISHIENMLKISSIIYAKLSYLNKL